MEQFVDHSPNNSARRSTTRVTSEGTETQRTILSSILALQQDFRSLTAERTAQIEILRDLTNRVNGIQIELVKLNTVTNDAGRAIKALDISLSSRVADLSSEVNTHSTSVHTSITDSTSAARNQSGALASDITNLRTFCATQFRSLRVEQETSQSSLSTINDNISNLGIRIEDVRDLGTQIGQEIKVRIAASDTNNYRRLINLKIDPLLAPKVAVCGLVGTDGQEIEGFPTTFLALRQIQEDQLHRILERLGLSRDGSVSECWYRLAVCMGFKPILGHTKTVWLAGRFHPKRRSRQDTIRHGKRKSGKKGG